MRQNERQGLSDLTTSEGYLKRFTLIARLIQPARVSGPSDIIAVVRKETGLTKTGGTLTHPEVIMRHVRIMSHIGILSSPDEGYRVSSDGKALIQLTGKHELNMGDGELTTEEKIFYFVRLFSSVFWQLYLLLLALLESDDKTIERLIADYFASVLDKRLRIWSHQQVDEGLDRYSRRGELPTMFKNRFECMSMWLTQLGLVDKGVVLSNIGKEFTGHMIHRVNRQQEVSGNLYGVATIYINGLADSLPRFSFGLESQRLGFMKLFDDAYRVFETPDLQMSDAKAMRTYLCTKMLLYHSIVFEEQDFDEAIKRLTNEGLVRSAMSGRDGKLAYIKVV
jgi:hypothetical protein